VSDRRRDQGGVYHSFCDLQFSSPTVLPPALRLLSSVCLQLDKGLGVGAVVDLDVDLWVFLALLLLSAQPPAVAQKITGQAESQHGQDQ